MTEPMGATDGGRLKVFLVDDHAMFRAGVRAELGAHVDVIGEASSVAEAVSKIGALEPDVVLLDVHMPDGGGRAVLDAFASRPDVPVADPELDQLTNREREVLRLLARGYAYKEIAKELYISIKTVETHVSNVLRKLQMSNRYELSRWAADRRLV
jgi:DNA-binding NarL/FixJ family response regulator